MNVDYFTPFCWILNINPSYCCDLVGMILFWNVMCKHQHEILRSRTKRSLWRIFKGTNSGCATYVTSLIGRDHSEVTWDNRRKASPDHIRIRNTIEYICTGIWYWHPTHRYNQHKDLNKRWKISHHDAPVWLTQDEFDDCCRIWSWSPMPCEKRGPKDSVSRRKRGRRPRFLSSLRPEGHVIQTAWETMIKSYYSTLADRFFPVLYSHKYEFQWLLGNSYCYYGLVAKRHRWIIVLKTCIPALLD